MPSKLYRNLFHIEDNVYMNDDLIICRFFKLVWVFFKTQNVFAFYLLKKSKECNVSAAVMALINSDNPAPILEKLIGTSSPDPLACSVEGYEVKLIPQCLGNYDILISFETQQSFATRSKEETAPCIVYLNDYVDINPVKLFHVLSSSSSPNDYVKNNLITKYKDVFEDVPSHHILMLTQRSLLKNVNFISNGGHDITIHLIHEKTYFTPAFPAINFTILYLEEDKHLIEPLLPQVKSHTPHFSVKKLKSFEGYF